MISKQPARRLKHSCTLAVNAVERHFKLKGQDVEGVKAALALRKDLEARQAALRKEISEKGISKERIAKSKRMNALLARIDVLISGKTQTKHNFSQLT